MKIPIHANRRHVEEQLTRSGLSLCKQQQVSEQENKCLYGYEEEYPLFEVIYKNGIVSSVIMNRSVWRPLGVIALQRRLQQIAPHGRDREKVESDIARFLFREPVGEKIKTEKGTLQKYGLWMRKRYVSNIEIEYDDREKVIDWKIVTTQVLTRSK